MTGVELVVTVVIESASSSSILSTMAGVWVVVASEDAEEVDRVGDGLGLVACTK